MQIYGTIFRFLQGGADVFQEVVLRYLKRLLKFLSTHIISSVSKSSDTNKKEKTASCLSVLLILFNNAINHSLKICYLTLTR